MYGLLRQLFYLGLGACGNGSMAGKDGEGAMGPDLYSETCAPRVMRWRRFRVHFEKVVQDMKEGQDMVSIAPELCFPNIIDNHVADFFGSMLSGEKVARQRRCRHFRYVLVLGDTGICTGKRKSRAQQRPHLCQYSPRQCNLRQLRCHKPLPRQLYHRLTTRPRITPRSTGILCPVRAGRA